MIYKTGKKIDTESCQKLAKELRELMDQGEDLIIDMSGTEYISSAGIREILIALKTCRAKGYDFSVINPNDFVKNIFRMTGLANILLYDKDIEGQKGKK